MNRLVLIGNGFDLAHGLKTSYKDFIVWYWEQWKLRLLSSDNKVESDGLCTFKLKDSVGLHGWYLVWGNHYKRTNIETPWKEMDIIDTVKNDKDTCEFEYISPFFQRINQSIETKGWVDIENEYYKLLEQNTLVRYSEEEIIKLNKQLAYLQGLLTEYLLTINQQDIPVNNNIKRKIYEPIKIKDVSVGATFRLKKYIDSCNDKDLRVWETKLYNYGLDALVYISDVEDYKSSPSTHNEPIAYMLPESIMLLDFNYTKTAHQYLLKDKDIFSHIHIHGQLNKPEGVIFGYGDEFDDKYRRLQALDNNECLANIKTIKYQESDNYRKVLQFIESAPFQVYIMGHSCGNSDRTLLNTIFEHDNCISIKPFFYKKEDGSDSYIETIQNISRNFNDMKLMRDRVVNKLYCEALTE